MVFSARRAGRHSVAKTRSITSMQIQLLVVKKGSVLRMGGEKHYPRKSVKKTMLATPQSQRHESKRRAPLYTPKEHTKRS